MDCPSCNSADTYYDKQPCRWRCRKCGHVWSLSYGELAERAEFMRRQMSKERHYSGLLEEQINSMEGAQDAIAKTDQRPE